MAEATVVRYLKLARSVLRQRVTEDGRVENLAPTDIVAFLSAESSPLSVGSTNGRVAELQALPKFLYVAGAAAAGHAGATGRGPARHRRPQSEPRR